MATTKKTAAKSTAAETETAAKTTAAKTETATAKKAPAKKAPAKKAAPKKTAPKKVAPKKPVETAVESKVDFFVEYGGVQVSVDEVIKNIKLTLGKDAKNISVYLKPEESKAYFVADGEEKEMDVFFC